MVNFYKVGGCVRDAFMKRKCKDIDYSVEAPSYEDMRIAIINRGGTIFLESPEYLTIRAKVPKFGACDFVLCRKDGTYKDNRHPESVVPGTLYDDLSRRDFSMNAIAEAEDGSICDPFNGIDAIRNKLIKCVGKPAERFNEDALRLLRAIRFSITLDFTLSEDIQTSLHDPKLVDKLKLISKERVREELLKCFKHNTRVTLNYFRYYPLIADAVLDTGLWLEPTFRL